MKKLKNSARRFWEIVLYYMTNFTLFPHTDYNRLIPANGLSITAESFEKTGQSLTASVSWIGEKGEKSMEKEKIQQFFELLDGVSQKEWMTLREKADFLYKLQALDNKMTVSKENAEYFAEQVSDELDTLREVYRSME